MCRQFKCKLFPLKIEFTRITVAIIVRITTRIVAMQCIYLMRSAYIYNFVWLSLCVHDIIIACCNTITGAARFQIDSVQSIFRRLSHRLSKYLRCVVTFSFSLRLRNLRPARNHHLATEKKTQLVVCVRAHYDH